MRTEVSCSGRISNTYKKIAGYWNLTSFILLSMLQRFREIYYLDIQDRITRTLILIFTALRHEIFKTVKIFLKNEQRVVTYRDLTACRPAFTSTRAHTPCNLARNGVFELCSTVTSCGRSINTWLTLFKWITM